MGHGKKNVCSYSESGNQEPCPGPAFRDEKTGEVFDADDALDHVFNCADCNIGSCPIGKRIILLRVDCCTFVETHPAEAAGLMGLTVVRNLQGGESKC